ncbi:hypothetical protein M501DRAFT_1013726 [Patellaria atrata CBS 101060]|uniref:Uncharacterized protein n=1 Tax=Patellaria atrata CBS 101060 TaxID=1346257 RepID=A0A9P4VUV7_9PEZI|nr:hypothetical protein M501DRAFT_1013726 [Patellaria atrata CBS 101060]
MSHLRQIPPLPDNRFNPNQTCPHAYGLARALANNTIGSNPTNPTVPPAALLPSPYPPGEPQTWIHLREEIRKFQEAIAQTDREKLRYFERRSEQLSGEEDDQGVETVRLKHELGVMLDEKVRKSPDLEARFRRFLMHFQKCADPICVLCLDGVKEILIPGDLPELAPQGPS